MLKMSLSFIFCQYDNRIDHYTPIIYSQSHKLHQNTRYKLFFPIGHFLAKPLSTKHSMKSKISGIGKNRAFSGKNRLEAQHIFSLATTQSIVVTARPTTAGTVNPKCSTQNI
jgi:hypothetical protein